MCYLSITKQKIKRKNCLPIKDFIYLSSFHIEIYCSRSNPFFTENIKIDFLQLACCMLLLLLLYYMYIT